MGLSCQTFHSYGLCLIAIVVTDVGDCRNTIGVETEPVVRHHHSTRFSAACVLTVELLTILG
jgi:hypothetical protein